MERDFWIFSCVCVYVIIGFECIPLSSGRRNLGELLPLPCGYISVCLCVCVSPLCLWLSRFILSVFIPSTPPGLLFFRLPGLQYCFYIKKQCLVCLRVNSVNTEQRRGEYCNTFR